MIIFDLDGTLADCEHRRHFVDKGKLCKWSHSNDGEYYTDGLMGNKVDWKPNWNAFYEACDYDEPIESVISVFTQLMETSYNQISIWSGRCESVKDKTLKWLHDYVPRSIRIEELKMRPVGDYTPDDELKERWLDEAIKNHPGTYDICGQQTTHPIDFVFDDRPKVIRMWRRRGIFVFNCCQHEEEF